MQSIIERMREPCVRRPNKVGTEDSMRSKMFKIKKSSKVGASPSAISHCVSRVLLYNILYMR